MVLDRQNGRLNFQSAEQCNEEGTNFINTNEYLEALKAFDTAISIDRNYKFAWNNRAYVLTKLNRLDEALEALNHALQIDPRYVYAWHLKGKVLGSRKRYKEASEAFAQVVAIDPTFIEGWNDRGEVLLQQRNYDDALMSFNRAIAIDSSYQKAQCNKMKCIELSKIYTIENDIASIKKTLPDVVERPEINSIIAVLEDELKSSAQVAVVESDYNRLKEKINNIVEEKTQRERIESLRKRTQTLLASAESFGVVPHTIYDLLNKEDVASIERVSKEIHNFISSAKPALSLTFGSKNLIVNKWHKVGIEITNSGNAHALDVTLTFSEEFETKRIVPVNIPSGKSITIEIGVKPKIEGSIPFEITSSFRDANKKSYSQTDDFWIDVTNSMNMTPGMGAATPSTPVGQFSPKPLTPKELPSDLAERYSELTFIGKGGFARVFKAKRNDGKYVAVKIPISLDASTGKSFIAEMQNWTKLNHSNIVRVFDYNIMPLPYFEMELCDGSLTDMKKPVETEEAAWILFNICEGLKYTHKRSIVHRDLKPQNILLKSGIPKISDWGLSKVISDSTSTTAASFTPYYAAPEQVNSKPKDERTDIWQLGVILYELATGELPFTGESVVDVAVNISTRDPKRPSEINPDAKQIEPVILKCLAKDPAQRYKSVLELQKALTLYLRKNYAEQLSLSVSTHDFSRSAFYCGDLVIINLLTGDIAAAYKYVSDLAAYAEGEVKDEALDLSEQLRNRIEYGITDIPDELIKKAEFIVHKVSHGFRTM